MGVTYESLTNPHPRGGGFRVIGDVILLQNKLKVDHVTYKSVLFQSFRKGRLHPWQQINSKHLEWCPCKSLLGFGGLRLVGWLGWRVGVVGWLGGLVGGSPPPWGGLVGGVGGLVGWVCGFSNPYRASCLADPGPVMAGVVLAPKNPTEQAVWWSPLWPLFP